MRSWGTAATLVDLKPPGKEGSAPDLAVWKVNCSSVGIGPRTICDAPRIPWGPRAGRSWEPPECRQSSCSECSGPGAGQDTSSSSLRERQALSHQTRLPAPMLLLTTRSLSWPDCSGLLGNGQNYMLMPLHLHLKERDYVMMCSLIKR